MQSHVYIFTCKDRLMYYSSCTKIELIPQYRQNRKRIHALVCIYMTDADAWKKMQVDEWEKINRHRDQVTAHERHSPVELHVATCQKTLGCGNPEGDEVESLPFYSRE